jgi:hypothetical protein
MSVELATVDVGVNQDLHLSGSGGWVVDIVH